MENKITLLQWLAGGLALLATVFAAWSAFGVGGGFSHEDLPRYGPSPAFRLVGADAKPYDSALLKGKVWVASFVYSTCKNSCPMLGVQMRRLSESIPAADGFRMVSITVDPERDTPARLAKYAKELGASDPRWSFLSGGKKELKALINQGFKLAAETGGAPDERGEADILHSSKLVLVDAEGVVRGYYDGLLGDSVAALGRDIQRLLDQAPKRAGP